MAEDGVTEGAAPATEAAQQPNMKILAQFIRDMSFENILAQKGTAADSQPEVSVQVNLDAKKRNETQFEVIVKLNITSQIKGAPDPLFLLELDYAGIFQLDNIPDEQMHPFLMIECPRMLFPFIRRVVSDVTRDGGFPSLNLETIDFLALYRNEMARRIKEQQTAGTA